MPDAGPAEPPRRGAERELARLVEDLVAIDSVNPDLVPGGAGEQAIARFVERWLRSAGLETRLVEAAPGRPNAIGVARGRGGGRTLLLNAHLDTVGVAGMERPFAPRIEGDRLYGRGAYDMKGGLAAIMLAGAAAVGAGLAGDVVVAAVADEELGSVGTEALVREVRADAAVIPEPTDLAVAVAHRGFVGFEVETSGVAAHGSRPDLGVDAIAGMGPAIVALNDQAARLAAAAAHPLLGTGSLHCSLIEGGQELSSYPARCLLAGERRTLPGETRDRVERELAEALAGCEADIRIGPARDAYACDPDSEIVRLVCGHAGAEPGGAPFWTDVALLGAARIPTVLYGPAGGGAHAEVEWVDLPSVERVRAVLVAAARDFCGAPS
ncbi:MAG TPA: M20/M25/M40 family metallo-hydrolase [Gaiellaceae bacterium]|nr:M20/M25/M40 family metallo-hydrolase [Gaiellaceae bacterium]